MSWRFFMLMMLFLFLVFSSPVDHNPIRPERAKTFFVMSNQ